MNLSAGVRCLLARAWPAGAALLVLSLLLMGGEIKLSKPMPAHDGETCIVCNTRVTSDDVAYLVDGQRFAVMREMEDDFLADPLKYISKYRPADILFGADSHQPMPNLYLLVGVYLLLGILFAALTGQMAMEKGYEPWRWCLAGLFFTLPAYVYLAMAPRKATLALPPGLGKWAATREPVLCPECGRSNHPSARACPACGAVLTPGAASEVEQIRENGR